MKLTTFEFNNTVQGLLDYVKETWDGVTFDVYANEDGYTATIYATDTVSGEGCDPELLRAVLKAIIGYYTSAFMAGVVTFDNYNLFVAQWSEATEALVDEEDAEFDEDEDDEEDFDEEEDEFDEEEDFEFEDEDSEEEEADEEDEEVDPLNAEDITFEEVDYLDDFGDDTMVVEVDEDDLELAAQSFVEKTLDEMLGEGWILWDGDVKIDIKTS